MGISNKSPHMGLFNQIQQYSPFIIYEMWLMLTKWLMMYPLATHKLNSSVPFRPLNLQHLMVFHELCLYYCETRKTVNTWQISGMLIVWWPITIMLRTREQTSKPQTNYGCCLRFSYLMPYWLFPCNTITFHKYFWCSRFCEFHSLVFL